MTRLFRPGLAAALLLALALTLACRSAQEQAPQLATETPSAKATAAVEGTPPSDATATPAARTAGPGETLWRWGDITVVIPDGSGVTAGPGPASYARPTQGFMIIKGDPNDSRRASSVVIDGDSAVVVEDYILDEHRGELNQILSTVGLNPLDRSSAPWPYSAYPAPDPARRSAGGLSYIRPSPSTGLYVELGIGTPGGPFVDLRNDRSVAFVSIDNATGRLAVDTSVVHADDLPVFERWLAAVKRCGTEVEC